VFLGITGRLPDANERHYAFMLEGLRETQAALQVRGLQRVVWYECPELAATKLAAKAPLVSTDRGYTRVQKRWPTRVARVARCFLARVHRPATSKPRTLTMLRTTPTRTESGW